MTTTKITTELIMKMMSNFNKNITQSNSHDSEKPTVALILGKPSIGDGIDENVTCIMINEDNADVSGNSLIWKNISTKNDDMAHLVVQSPLQTYESKLSVYLSNHMKVS